jgi:lysophospholipase L1-like esterase
MRPSLIHNWWMGGVSYSAVTAVFGTLSDPASGGSTLNKTTTWVMMESLPVESELHIFKVYCTATGTLKLKVLQPANGGFNVIYNVTLTISSVGLNTFSVEAGTLTEFTIPANCVIGLHTPSSGGATLSYTSDSAAYNIGYMAGTGDLSGNGVVLNTVSYRDLIQAQVTVQATRQNFAQYIINESYAGTTLPAYGINNTGSAWTFATGYMQNAGTGLANFFDFYPSLNIDRHTVAIEFQFQAAGDRIALGKKPILGGGGAAEGTLCEADLNNNRLVIYQTWSGSTTLPSSSATLTLTEITLQTGRTYRLELTKSQRTNYVRIIDTLTLDEETLTSASGAAGTTGYCYGRPSISVLAGTVRVSKFQLYASVNDIDVLILGDSITEGATTADSTGFAQLTIDALNGDGWYDGDGGTISTNCLRRLRQDLRASTPPFVVIYIGANNANSDIDTTQFETDIVNIYNEIANAGATPVICTLTPNSNATVNSRVQTMNTFLLSRGWTLARFDLSLSLNNDGVTYNAAVMADGVHPNTTGHALLKARLLLDWPQIF